MSINSGETDYIFYPTTESAQLPYKDYLDQVNPSLYGIAAVGLSGVAYAARTCPELLDVPLLSDGVNTRINPDFVSIASASFNNGSRTIEYAEQGARLVAIALATSRLLVSPMTQHSIGAAVYGKRMHRAETRVDGLEDQILAGRALGRIYVSSVVSKFQESLSNGNLDIAALCDLDEFGARRSRFLNLRTTRTSLTSIAKIYTGDTVDNVGSVDEHVKFGILDRFTQAINSAEVS